MPIVNVRFERLASMCLANVESSDTYHANNDIPRTEAICPLLTCRNGNWQVQFSILKEISSFPCFEATHVNSTKFTAARPLSSLLRLAVVTGVARAVQAHIARGDDLNARDSKGLTPLMLAAAKNKAAICKILLEAGADSNLQDPEGKTAHEIARSVGAEEAAAVIAELKIQPIEQVKTDALSILETVRHDETDEQASDNLANHDGAYGPPTTVNIDIENAEQTGAIPQGQFLTEKLTGEEYPTTIKRDAKLVVQTDGDQASSLVASDDDLEFDLTGWEAEEERPPPAGDPVVSVVAGATQAAISLHVPVNTYVEWIDVDAFLPDKALPVARAADTETRSKIRRLLLRAIRERVVSDQEVDELSFNEDGTKNTDSRELLQMIINDLGAEIDDWMGPESSWVISRSFETSAELPEEEAILDEALEFIDTVDGHRNEPLRAYQREFQQIPLITPEEEVALGQLMEKSLDAALDALATWNLGISRTIEAGMDVMDGVKPISSMSYREAEAESDSDDEMVDLDGAAVEFISETDFLLKDKRAFGEPSFSQAINELARHAVDAGVKNLDTNYVREALSVLNLSRSFLVELAEIPDSSLTGGRVAYVSAIAEYLKAREAMTCANLKLAFHIGKKYLYSGLSLDDLTQEANLGLLKAVDKYDWRRGFRFSTYATWWIRQQVSRYVADKGRTIRVPVHIHEKIQRLRRSIDEFEKSNGRSANIEELTKLVDMPPQTVSGILRLLPDAISLNDVSIDEFGSAGVEDFFVSPDPMEIISALEIAKVVNNILDTLEVKQAKVIRLRYGIGGDDPMTLDEVGKCLNLTRERIRQIESKILKDLKSSFNFARKAIEIGDSPQIKRRRRSRAQDVSCGNYLEGISSRNLKVEVDSSRQDIKKSLKSAAPNDSRNIDKVLLLASNLGVECVDERNGPSGRVWVNLVDASNGQYRKLARKLLDLDFVFSPGQGYCR